MAEPKSETEVRESAAATTDARKRAPEERETFLSVREILERIRELLLAAQAALEAAATPDSRTEMLVRTRSRQRGEQVEAIGDALTGLSEAVLTTHVQYASPLPDPPRVAAEADLEATAADQVRFDGAISETLEALAAAGASPDAQEALSNLAARFQAQASEASFELRGLLDL